MPGPTLDMILRALPVALSAGAMLFAWLAGRRKDVDERIAGHDDRLNNLERAYERMEQGMAAMPKKDDLHSLELALTRVSAGMETINTALAGQRDATNGVSQTVRRVEEYLLQDK